MKRVGHAGCFLREDMRSIRCALLLAVVGCASSSPPENAAPTPDARAEDSREAGQAGEAGGAEEPGPISCSDRPACQVAVGDKVTWQPATVSRFCSRERWPTHASSGLWPACLIDQAGTVYLMWLGGSELIEMPGWTHGPYGGPTIDGTTSAADGEKCKTAAAMVPMLVGSPVCSPSK